MFDTKNKALRKSWKLTLLDLLIAATFFFILTGFTSQIAHAGTPGRYYVLGTNNQGSTTYYGVRSNQQTVNPYVYSGSAVYSFASLTQSNHDFFAIGFMKGTNPANGQWLSTPYYYVDRVLNGVYQFWLLNQATVGENHLYTVYTNYYGNSISASIDGVLKKSESGYLASGKQAAGQTEALNTDDVMNHHLWGMQFRTVESRWFSFYNNAYVAHNPFHINVISSTEWYAYK